MRFMRANADVRSQLAALFNTVCMAYGIDGPAPVVFFFFCLILTLMALS